MCPSFTWGTASVHYLLGLPLAYALRSATPNSLMLLVKLTYSPVLLRPIESLCLLVPYVLFSYSPSRHTVLLYLPSFACPVAVGTNLIIPRAPLTVGIHSIGVQYGYSPFVPCQQFSCVLSNLVLNPPVSALHYLFCRLVPQPSCVFFPCIPFRLR